ncbi:CPA_1a_G0041910.mRNA.1.CDS.1 [Saccharomyces cerevisiae]|nr:CPA_1a_G0041910.mRNA.1.CDS.1 [Saccharomyces cerevisiae]CAI7429117.1 CPA_1a_G0041910.mRNA.1.CDS.1 [Saccharomyces cerevisiae]
MILVHTGNVLYPRFIVVAFTLEQRQGGRCKGGKATCMASVQSYKVTMQISSMTIIYPLFIFFFSLTVVTKT